MIFVTNFEKAKWFYRDMLGFALPLEEERRLVFTHERCNLVSYKCEKTNAFIGGMG